MAYAHWNYRVFHRCYLIADTPVEQYTVREAYYDDDGKVTGWSAEPSAPMGDTMEELEEDLAHMRVALDRAVIELIECKGGEQVASQ
jgi:hypothetical protein